MTDYTSWESRARPVRPGEELDVSALAAVLAARMPETRGALTVEQFPGGFSNLTYLLRAGDRELVLRRPPFGAGAIKSGHDMAREYRILSGLAPVYARAPRPIFLCEESESPLGAPFYLMERVRGVILRPPLPARLTIPPPLMESLSLAFVDALVELHQIDICAAGLADIGRPAGYLRRQVDGWTERYARARTDDVGDLDRIAAWLVANLPPEQPASLVHNDFKYDNLVLDPADLSSIRAVLDWEMATIGDPLADLGTSLAYWVQPDDAEELLALGIGLTTLPGNLTRAGVVTRYAERSGRDVSSILFYYVLALLKVAVIAQQLYFRYARGFTADPRFARLIHAVHALGAAGVRAIRQESLSA
jgi:aminoglycoside phosphotransferase (APT) family kinase protein